ncbi:MAG: SDR family oxidoreductase [Acidimicrobiales bacterium]|nr:SDR family oxidoreductase [Acidimicrobiales bacterium]
MKDQFGLQGTPALVIGGASGIGRATAVLLGEVGASVAVADLNPDGAAAVADEITAAGGTATSLAGDVLDPAGAAAVIDSAHGALGGLEVVVNIVGFAAWSSLLDYDLDTWNYDIRRNLDHHFFVGQAAARRFIADGVAGRIGMVASVSGLYGAPNHAAYGAAKAGVMALTRSMADEWGRYGIRANAVAPDCILTPRAQAGFDASGITEPDAIMQADGMPLGRWGRPEEIAGPMVFLVSQLASFMSGQTLVVDGGTQAHFPHTGANPMDEK